MPKQFIRRDSNRYSKIGKNRKKLQKWRKPKGRDNKMRERRHGYPKSPSMGYKKPKKEISKIKGKYPKLVYNLKDLDKARKDNIIIIGKVGVKKRLEIIKKVIKMKLTVHNLSTPNKETKN